MKRKNIPGTQLETGEICLGGGSFCSLADKETVFRLYDRYVDQGGNFIDTANVYGRWNPDGKNSSELLIGEWMKKRKNAAGMVITTKGGHPSLDHWESRLSKEEVAADLESSLAALETDHIDLYYLHRDDPKQPAGEIVEMMNDLIQTGKIRYYGVSNWTAARIAEAASYAAEHHLQGISANQPMWSLASVCADSLNDQTLAPMDDEMYFYHLKTGLAAVPYSAQAQGYFTKLDTDSAAAKELTAYDCGCNEQKYLRVKELAAREGKSINQIALAYLLCQPFAVFPIIGVKDETRMKDSLESAEVVLSQDDLLYLGLSAE